MTPQEAHHVTLCPQWKIVMNAMIESRRNELQFKAIKQDRWNNREADRQAEKAFLEEHKGPGKFSGKYGPQPTQTELVWRMPWGCWLEYNHDRMLSEAWNAVLRFSMGRGTLRLGKIYVNSFSNQTVFTVSLCVLGMYALFYAHNKSHCSFSLSQVMCTNWLFFLSYS